MLVFAILEYIWSLESIVGEVTETPLYSRWLVHRKPKLNLLGHLQGYAKSKVKNKK